MASQRVYCSASLLRVTAAQRLRRADILFGREQCHGALRYDGGLHVTVVAHQVPHHFQKVGERLDAVDEVARGDHAAADEIERPPDVRRRVMEAGFAGDLGIMEQVRVQIGFGYR